MPSGLACQHPALTHQSCPSRLVGAGRCRRHSRRLTADCGCVPRLRATHPPWNHAAVAAWPADAGPPTEGPDAASPATARTPAEWTRPQTVWQPGSTTRRPGRFRWLPRRSAGTRPRHRPAAAAGASSAGRPGQPHRDPGHRPTTRTLNCRASGPSAGGILRPHPTRVAARPARPRRQRPPGASHR